MNKPHTLYAALTEAVDNYNERNNCTRAQLADAVGYVGKNAAIQFSNALNPLNHSKTLNDEKKYILLHELDDEDRVIFFTQYMRQFNLRPVAIERCSITFVDMHDMIDDAMMEGDEAFKITKLALRDKTLDEDELRAIVKENTEAAQKYQELADMAQHRLDEVGVE